MGTTPNRAIPYAEPADPLAGYPAVDKASAERLDVLLFDTGWQAVAVLAGFAADAGNPPQVRRIGSVIYWRGGFTNTGLAASTIKNVGTIPAGWRPLKTVMTATGQTGAALGGMVFATSGNVDIRLGATVGANYMTDISWVLD